jgi:hypothetical protein
MSGRGSSRVETFTVPAGRRAVVRSFAVFYWTTSGQSAFLFVHGIPLYYRVNQVPNFSDGGELRLTAYAGETITFESHGPDVSYGVDGFLYYDDALEPDDADNEIISLPSTKPGGELPA